MAACTEVVVSLGYDAGPRALSPLHEYLTTPSETLRGQHLMQVCGDATHPHGLDGSHQAGALLIYAGLLRRVYSSDIKEWLLDAPWGYDEGDVIIYNEGDPIREVFTIKKES